MNAKRNLITIALASVFRPNRGHSWVEKVESVHGEGSSRVDLSLKDDIVLQRYFCPLPTLAECQPDPKHGIVLTEENMRPCRAGLISSTKAIVEPSTELTIHWAGNGHVGNGQSDGTCVKVMIADYDADPDFESFVDIPGAECLDFSGSNGSNEPQGTITVPDNLVAGTYTLLWFWDFTEFYYSSCIDIEVVDGTLPTPSPTKKELDHETIQDYLHNGCKDIVGADDFCKRYTTVSDSYCQVESTTDECGRSICYGVPDFLFPCSCPTGCPVPKSFYDDFSDGLDDDKWLIAHKSWGSGGGYINGGVVAENVAVDTESGTVLLGAHGNLYTGPVMGVNKDLTRQSTGVRTGSAIATRQYLGAGSYEVRMKVIGKLGVSSAIWTFFYNDDEYSTDNESPIVNHEIDIELPGRPAAPATGMDFGQVLLNTWIGELENLYETGYTTIPFVDDDEFHTWRFDWHTDPNDRRIDFFLDGEHIRTMRNDNIPFYAGRLWIGAWFPKSWAGVPDFDQDQVEVDYVKFTPYNEVYECPPESYPNFGWAPGSTFESQEEALCPASPSSSSPTKKPSTTPHTAMPIESPTPPPMNDEFVNIYLSGGCASLHSNFCSTFISGSYCKDWSQDDCGRAVCQGHAHSSLDLCDVSPDEPPSETSLYLSYGCNSGLSDSFCFEFNGGYCKDWQSDDCGRSICQGDDFSSLDAC